MSQPYLSPGKEIQFEMHLVLPISSILDSSFLDTLQFF